MKPLRNELNYPQLKESTKNLIRELCETAFNDNCETWNKGQVKEIEFESRDGFIPFSHNHGGISVKGFTDVQGIIGSGNLPAHKKAAAEIERQQEFNYKLVAESAFENFQKECKARKLTEKDCYYNTIQELEEKNPEDDFYSDLLLYIENEECNTGSEDSIMYEIQFMYCGFENKKHKAWVSAAVNTEGPYHRRSISWAPNVFCEGAKEIEITWTTNKDLKTKLEKALNKCVKGIF